MDYEIRDIDGRVIFRADLDTQPEPAAECAKAAVKLARNRAVSLARANLAFADLAGANLSYLDLRKADLCGADLSFADLRSADLRGADLRNANLRYANLRRADLGDANLEGSNLEGAMLNGAKIRKQKPRTPSYLKQLMPGPIVTLRMLAAPGGKLTLELPPKRSLIVGPLAVHPAIRGWRGDFCDDTIDGEVFFCSAHHVDWSNKRNGYQVSHLKSGYSIVGDRRKPDAIALAHHLTKPGNGIDWDAMDPDNPTREHGAMLNKIRSALIEWREANGVW